MTPVADLLDLEGRVAVVSGASRGIGAATARLVTVDGIAPGQIDTSPDLLTDEQRAAVTELIPLGRLGEPEEVAHAVLFLVSPMGSYITGATIDVNGGILKP